MEKFICGECGFLMTRSSVEVLDDCCPKCGHARIRIIRKDDVLYQEYRNEFDATIIVCTDCTDGINDGITDDREYWHSPKTVVRPQGSCNCCDW